MVIYTCDKCNYSTNRKNDFFKHLNRKNPCTSNYNSNDNQMFCKKNVKCHKIDSELLTNDSQMTHNDSQNTNFDSQMTHKIPNLTHNDSQMTHNDSQISNNKLDVYSDDKIINNINTQYECTYCNKIFTRKNNLIRHINKYCKKKRLLNEIDEKQIKEIAWESERDQLYKVIDNLSQSKGNTINNTFNQTINMNNFGEENLKYLSGSFLSNLLKIPFNALPNLIKEIHFNPEHPENNNIKISNKKLPYAEVFKDNCWKIQDKKETINDLLDKGVGILENHFDDNSDLNDSQKDRFIQFKTTYDDKNDKDLNRKISKDIEICLLNGS